MQSTAAAPPRTGRVLGVVAYGTFLALMAYTAPLALGREAVAGVPADQADTGSGINNTSRYVGAALGVTVVAALAGGSGAELVSGWNVACWMCAASSVAGAVAVAALRPAAAPARPSPAGTVAAWWRNGATGPATRWPGRRTCWPRRARTSWPRR